MHLLLQMRTKLRRVCFNRMLRQRVAIARTVSFIVCNCDSLHARVSQLGICPASARFPDEWLLYPGQHRCPIARTVDFVYPGAMAIRMYSIDASVFALFPGYMRGVVIANGVRNGPSDPRLKTQLREAEARVRSEYRIETLAAHPRVQAWREAYRGFGAKPSKFRPSMEALLRRVLHGEQLRSISALVDIGTIISLRHLVPSGGHAIDVVKGDLCLRPAVGNETFTAFGSDIEEHPEPGEIVFTEGGTVLTRRWTWRQATHTLLTQDSTAVEFNVDGLPPVSQQDIEGACTEIAELVTAYCGGSIRTQILSEGSPMLSL